MVSKATIRAKKRVVVPGLATISDQGHENKPYLLGKLLMDFLQFYGDDFRQRGGNRLLRRLGSWLVRRPHEDALHRLGIPRPVAAVKARH